ncbi:MAG: redoxin domain-containing protein [Akkermansiaceae bacterium]|nr:redoxin domain-containing protein [Akkermansiaceae bacterium]
MKHKAFFLTLLAGLFIGTQPLTFADTTDATEEVSAKPKKKSKKGKKSKKKEAKIGVVGEFLQGATFFTEVKPNPAATHYFILESASWCGPCKAVMPKIIEQYPKMREAGVELILLASENEAGAKKYLAGYNAEFAGILPVHITGMPGFVKGNGIPNMCLIDADGNTVTTGHGRMVLQWRQLTNQPDSDGPGAVAEALEGMEFFNGKPSKTAKYYVYLHSSSTCVACKTFIPTIVKAYKKMKKAKVEVIHVNHDSTKETAKKYVKAERMKCPAVMDADAHKLPGYTPVSVLPGATVVDKHGTVIKSGHASLLNDWETFCK